MVSNKTSLQISPYSKIKVEWADLPENYSRAEINKITNYFANKYGVNKNNIQVNYRAIKYNNKGELIDRDQFRGAEKDHFHGPR